MCKCCTFNPEMPEACLAAQTEGARTSPYHKNAKLAKPLALVKMTLEQSVNCSAEVRI